MGRNSSNKSDDLVPHLPAEAGEEDLTVLVFVLQLLGDSDEAAAGLRAVSHLQEWKKPSVILTSRQLRPRTMLRTGERVVLSYETLGDLLQPPSSLFIAFNSTSSRSKLGASGCC